MCVQYEILQTSINKYQIHELLGKILLVYLAIRIKFIAIMNR